MYVTGFLWTGLITLVNLASPCTASHAQCPVKVCLVNKAERVNNTCICKPPYDQKIDNGNFACYRNKYLFGEVKSDPNVINFNQERSTFPFPCRYLFTSVVSRLRINKQNVGTCKCVHHIWHEKDRGKFYVGGLDFACLVNNTNTNEELGFGVRIQGIAYNGTYNYTEHAVGSFQPDGPFPAAKTPLNANGAGIHVHTVYDAANNQMTLSIPECGHYITFVAYDIEKRLCQDQIPGISHAVSCARGPKFYDEGRVIATAPVKFGGKTYKTLSTGFSSVEDFLLYRGFTSNVIQNQPNAAPECSDVGTSLPDCNAVDLNFCFSFLGFPKFIQCCNPEKIPSDILQLVWKCAQYYCEGGISCNAFRNSYISNQCQTQLSPC